MASARRAELNIPLAVAARLGTTALMAAESGVYVDEEGRDVRWGASP
jgi:hypothetical protein